MRQCLDVFGALDRIFQLRVKVRDTGAQRGTEFAGSTTLAPVFLGDTGQRRSRRVLLALSWLSVESEEGAPNQYVVGRTGGVKVLARGDIAKKLTIRAHKFSGKAAEKIAAAGGTAEVLT